MGDYRKSNIECFGEYPSSWIEAPLKYFFNYTKGSNAALYTKEFLGDNIGDIPVYSGQTANNGILGYTNRVDYYNTRGIIVSTVGAKAMSTKIVDGDFCLSQNCALLTTKDDFNVDYGNYLLSILFDFEKNKLANVMIPSLRFEDLDSYIILVPPKQIQIRIAEFLDKKTAEIDAIIEKKKALLLRLEEKKKAIINEVTIGKKVWDRNAWNEPVEIKYSGIQWIGEIPVYWEVKPLGFLGTCQNGVSKGGDYFGTGFPFVNYGDIYKNYELPNEVEGLAQSTEEDRLAYSVQYGDVFFTRTSETIEEIGIASTCLKTIENAVFSGFTIRFRPYSDKELLPLFSKYLFRSNYIRTALVKEMNLVTRASLGQNLLKSIKIIIPPINEQKNIAEFLERKFNESNTISSSILSQIEKLKEYRQALISEAVTGKLEIA